MIYKNILKSGKMVDIFSLDTVPKKHSKERGCNGKANLGRNYKKQADKFSDKHDKQYGVYKCHHCGGFHLTTKIDNAHLYAPLLYLTNED